MGGLQKQKMVPAFRSTGILHGGEEGLWVSEEGVHPFVVLLDALIGQVIACPATVVFAARWKVKFCYAAVTRITKLNQWASEPPAGATKMGLCGL